jgi:hypothetical protein
VASGWKGLENLAARGGAGGSVLGFGEALTLAGILALAGRRRAALAGALALAGVGAATMHALGVSGGGEGAGGEDRSGSRNQRALVHENLLNVRAFRSRQVIRREWPQRYARKELIS